MIVLVLILLVIVVISVGVAMYRASSLPGGVTIDLGSAGIWELDAPL
jgi:hypothetical protein